LTETELDTNCYYCKTENIDEYMKPPFPSTVNEVFMISFKYNAYSIKTGKSNDSGIATL
jgi:hypothetical protein